MSVRVHADSGRMGDDNSDCSSGQAGLDERHLIAAELVFVRVVAIIVTPKLGLTVLIVRAMAHKLNRTLFEE